MFKNFKLSRDIGIDLGTATVQVYVQDKGIVIREPSVVAIDKTTDKVIKVGREAQDLVGRAPDGIFTLRPLKDGDINEYEVTYKMLQYFIRRASGNTLLPPRIMLALPATLSEVEERAVHEAAAEAGARKSFIVPSPVAAALGAGLDVRSPIGNMIVDIGGGVCEVAVISLGGIVVSKSIKIGGDSFDEAIVRYVNDAYGLMIGERTAEGIKKKIGEVYEHKEAKIVEVKRRDIVTAMPKVINLSSKEMIGATFEPMTALIDCICEIIEKTPPELVGDILHNGIMLVGGGAKLSGLDKLIHRVTGIKTYVADDPEDCVVKGAAAKLESINKYSIEG